MNGEPGTGNREPGTSTSFPWLPLIVFLTVSVGTTTAIAVVSAKRGWSMSSPAWLVLAPIAMWAPALASLVARRTVDRHFTNTLNLRRWRTTGPWVVWWPVALALGVYGTAYLIAWIGGFVYWNPGGGLWTSGSRIALNLVVNLSILAVYGTFNALGEEIGWRGYLQPRLDAAQVRGSVLIVGLSWTAYHAPFALADLYRNVGDLAVNLTRGVVLDVSLSFLWAYWSYRAGSLWPAVFFHSSHNAISQWLFPKFFTVIEHDAWLGEGGILPLTAYALVALTLLACGSRFPVPRSRFSFPRDGEP